MLVKVIKFFKRCCFPSHIEEVYENVKDLLHPWYMIFRDSPRENQFFSHYEYECWLGLISVFSSVPSLIPQLSPSLDIDVEWSRGVSIKIDRYLNEYNANVAAHISRLYFSKLLCSVPMVSMIPSSEISICVRAKTYPFATHICSALKFFVYFSNRYGGYHYYEKREPEIMFHDIVTGLSFVEGDRCRKFKEFDKCCILYGQTEDGDMKRKDHSPYIKYARADHLLAIFPYEKERQMRHSIYDRIEQTSAGVEILFEPDTCSFEGYDQDEWRREMMERNEKGKCNII
ncbi:hypothetical protein ADUPG1_000725 [Aduncisulcus paluster]|uniref:Uncharacterized protein n=1 Tax=Aduncisulcus paluster TaxID=2918883 RepID=A0ABQ5K9F2_9EUKA|nr:hypothetical protein ADUPG1_000725 [Aduncisulcus paluster]